MNVCRIKLYEIFINFILKHVGFKSAIQIRFPCFLSDSLYSFLLMPDLSSVLLQQYFLKLTFFGLTCFFLCQHLGDHFELNIIIRVNLTCSNMKANSTPSLGMLSTSKKQYSLK